MLTYCVLFQITACIMAQKRSLQFSYGGVANFANTQTLIFTGNKSNKVVVSIVVSGPSSGRSLTFVNTIKALLTVAVISQLHVKKYLICLHSCNDGYVLNKTMNHISPKQHASSPVQQETCPHDKELGKKHEVVQGSSMGATVTSVVTLEVTSII